MEDRQKLPADYATICPHCGHRMNEHDLAAPKPDGTVEVIDKMQPTPGDFSFCIGCGEPSRFSPEGPLRALTPDDETDLTPELHAVIRRVQAARVSALFSYKAAGKKWLGRKL